MDVPIDKKLTLTIEEAAQYSNIGINRLSELAKQPEAAEFILHVGKKRLFKRRAFEDYVMKQSKI